MKLVLVSIDIIFQEHLDLGGHFMRDVLQKETANTSCGSKTYRGESCGS